MRKKILLVFIVLITLALGIWWFGLHRENSSVNISFGGQSSKKQTSKTPQTPTFDKNKFSHDDPSSIWVVVNKKRPLNPVSYAPSDLTLVGGGQQMRKEAANALSQLIAAAKAEKLSLQPLSGYRSYATQVSVYNKEVANYGQTVADSESAKPGTSEHQTGFAVDMGGGGCGIEDCFGKTAEGKWLAANAYKYGFIIRYIPGKEDITGYRPEPWHIRYIGTELSNEMHNENIITLEEFFNL